MWESAFQVKEQDMEMPLIAKKLESLSRNKRHTHARLFRGGISERSIYTKL